MYAGQASRLGGQRLGLLRWRRLRDLILLAVGLHTRGPLGTENSRLSAYAYAPSSGGVGANAERYSRPNTSSARGISTNRPRRGELRGAWLAVPRPDHCGDSARPRYRVRGRRREDRGRRGRGAVPSLGAPDATETRRIGRFGWLPSGSVTATPSGPRSGRVLSDRCRAALRAPP